jgi:hypothetical protein
MLLEAMRSALCAMTLVLLIVPRSGHAQEVQIGLPEAADVQVGAPAVATPAPSAAPPGDAISITAQPTPALPPPPPGDTSLRPWPRNRGDTRFDVEPPPQRQPMETAAQLEERTRSRRMSRGGAALFGATYALTLTMGLVVALGGSSGMARTEAWIACLPVIGPAIDAVLVAGASPVVTVVYVIDSLAQGAGIALMIAAAVHSAGHAPDPHAPRETARWTVLPTAPGATLGLSLQVANF